MSLRSQPARRLALQAAASRSSSPACTCTHHYHQTRSASSSAGSQQQHQYPRPPRGWSLPDFQAKKRAVNLPPPRIQKFENKVNLPNDGSMTVYTTAPRPKFVITRDTSTHPLWSFPSSSGSSSRGSDPVEDEGGRMGRFARKFGGSGAGTTARSSPSPSPPSQPTAAAQGKGKGEAKTGASSPSSQPKPSSSSGGEQKKRTSHQQQQAQASGAAAAAPKAKMPNEDAGMFDLALEGEVYEEPKQRIVEDKKSKAGKGGAGKKGKK